MKNIFKSIGAVLAGFLVVGILSVATDTVLEAAGVLAAQSHPEATVPWMLALALVYRSVYTVLGGYITTRLAPTNPMKHVVALMILGGLGGIGGVVNGWGYGNHWYPIALAVTGPVLVWVGGKLRIK